MRRRPFRHLIWTLAYNNRTIGANGVIHFDDGKRRCQRAEWAAINLTLICQRATIRGTLRAYPTSSNVLIASVRRCDNDRLIRLQVVKNSALFDKLPPMRRETMQSVVWSSAEDWSALTALRLLYRTPLPIRKRFTAAAAAIQPCSFVSNALISVTKFEQNRYRHCGLDSRNHRQRPGNRDAATSQPLENVVPSKLAQQACGLQLLRYCAVRRRDSNGVYTLAHAWDRQLAGHRASGDQAKSPGYIDRGLSATSALSAKVVIALTAAPHATDGAVRARRSLSNTSTSLWRHQRKRIDVGTCLWRLEHPDTPLALCA